MADGRDFRLATAVLAASGAAGLGYELLWTRSMMDLLGANAESSARVFGCFFLGLAFGAATVSLFLPKIRRPWLGLAAVELGVAIWCLPALLLPEWTGWIWPYLGPERLVCWQGSSLKWVLSVLVILPPSFLMGVTLPLVMSAICRRKLDLTIRGIWLYAANTLGGAVGLALVVLVLLQVFGAGGSMVVMIGINLAAAVACYQRSRNERSPAGFPANVTRPRQESARGRANWLPLLLAFLSGAGVLALEVLALAMVTLKAPVAIYPQAGVLLCVILLLALSASVVPTLVRRFKGPRRVLPTCLAAAGLTIALAPVVFMNAPGASIGYYGYGRGFGDFLLRLAAVTFMSLGVAVAFAGSVFPLLMAWCDEDGAVLPARKLAGLLAVNGIGGVAGAEASYRLLLPCLGAHVAIGIVGAAYALAGILLLPTAKGNRVAQSLLAVGAFFATCLVTSVFLVKLPVFLYAETFTVIDVRCGREGSLAVVQNETIGRAMIFDNQYLLGSTSVAPDMRREAHLPLLMHPAPEKVAFIGLGTGITAAGALQHKGVKSVTAVELSALVTDSARADFREFNDDVCRDPRAQVYVEDARTYLSAAKGRFDVIIGDLFTPWRPGEASLCSLEAFEAARGALRPGGVFCQWIQMTQWTQQQFGMAAATFRKAFGHLYLFRGHFRSKSLPVALVGFKNGHPDWKTVADRCDFERQQGRLLDPACRHAEGLAMLYLGEYNPPANSQGMINTLGNLRIELAACHQLVVENPENYFAGDGARWFDFLQGQLAKIDTESQMPASLRRLSKVGFLASRLELAWEASDPSAPDLEERLAAELPATITSDSAADWSLWPGTRVPSRFPAAPSPRGAPAGSDRN